MRVLTWNLFHGRSQPPAGRDLAPEFARALAAWDWELALLQEVPPWWPERLARAAGARWTRALTSRNLALPIRRAIAERRPDLARSNGGGCNAILARCAILASRSIRLRRWPERRIAQLVRLAGGTCAVNYHASSRAQLAEAELETLWRHALEYSREAPMILGGDLNLRTPVAPSPELVHVAARDVDHIFARGFDTCEPAQRLQRAATIAGVEVELSDHVPLLASLRRPQRRGC